MKFYSSEGTIGGPVGVSDLRRERIATAALQGLITAVPGFAPAYAAADAVVYADALIAELDKPKTMKVPT